ncbi:hypothetical protein [Syntrophorhabdus aromaticivorans]|jgi:hypothetical protein|nr:hypothetical protein [Syntrophorhabdus aromaticivorans]
MEYIRGDFLGENNTGYSKTDVPREVFGPAPAFFIRERPCTV